MMILRCPLWTDGSTRSLLARLFITLTLWLGHDARGHAAASLRDITVHQGQLSVHLQEADVRDVLTVIEQQTGITILADLRPGIQVSTHFSGMALDDGLRHLLRRASLSSTMVYNRGLTGALVLTAVHVFKEATGPAPHLQTVESTAEDRRDEAGQSFAEALAQLSAASPPPPQTGEHDGAERFRALLEGAQRHAPPPRTGEKSELARHFREVLEQTLESATQTKPDAEH
jgi:hypothetical protein